MLQSKENQISPKFAHKSGQVVLIYGSVFQNSPKVFKYLGYSCIKIAKSGHTGICVCKHSPKELSAKLFYSKLESKFRIEMED